MMILTVAPIEKLVGSCTIIKDEDIVTMLDVLVALIDSLISRELAVEENRLIGFSMLLLWLILRVSDRGGCK